MRLEGEGEECGYCEEGKRHQIIPSQPLLQKRDRESHEDDEGDHFLNDLELKS